MVLAKVIKLSVSSFIANRGEVHIGAQGRLVIPAKLRRELGLQEGDALVARTEAGRLILEKAEMTIGGRTNKNDVK